MVDKIINLKCRLSSLSSLSQPHTLSIRNGHLKFGCFFCYKKENFSNVENFLYFYCITCNVEFHADCNMMPRKILHPFHPQHPLTLTVGNSKTQKIANYNFEAGSSDPISPNLNWVEADSIFDKCSWCDGNISTPSFNVHVILNKFSGCDGNISVWNGFHLFYRCSICNFSLDSLCSERSPPLTIQNPKSHHHSLLLSARQFSSPCDACGRITKAKRHPSYVCHQCNYVVHESCINLPRVIKITRHPHRLFHTPYLPPKVCFCRICYKTVDVKYGHYSCKHEDCSYVAHSKCATHREAWDRRELEWEPEESEETEDISSFKSVGDDLIKHFGHDHNLRLEKYNGGRAIEKKCEACILPINFQNYYNCFQCNYVLHEVCAGLPRKLDHALHKHSLFLDPSSLITGNKKCSACRRKSAGFKYKCSKKDGRSCDTFNIDVRCSLVPDYFTHKSHEHPLIIATSTIYEDNCHSCKQYRSGIHYLQCPTCDILLCFYCVTIPTEWYYEHDDHPLSLCFGEDTNDKYWCEECEEELDPTKWFYTCNTCCTTIHRECGFGYTIYMKSGIKITDNYEMVEYFLNKNYTRPICSYCNNRCVDFMYYKWMEKIFCSLYCHGEAVAEEEAKGKI